MKHKTFSLLLIVLGLLGCTSLRKPFYYQIESPDGGKGYLLGTFHLGVPFEDLPSGVKAKFESSDPVYVEVDITSSAQNAQLSTFAEALAQDMEKSPITKIARILNEPGRKLPPQWAGLEGTPAAENIKKTHQMFNDVIEGARASAGKVAVKRAVFAGGESLKSRLSAGQWNYIVQKLQSIFVDEDTIETLHIETVLFFVLELRKPTAEVTRAKSVRLNPRWSMDLNLIKLAKENQKDVRAFEDADPLAPSCLAELYLIQIKSLLSKNGEEILSEIDRAEQAYRSGDLEELDRNVKSSDFAKISQCLVIDRNLNWIPKIDEQIRESKKTSRSPFFAFGAWHLVGPQGVIKLLQEKGYKVEKAKF